MRTVITLLLFAGVAAAANCQLSLKKEDLSLGWTAFKTPSKVGVTGGFKSLGLKKAKFTGKSIEGLLEGIEYAIDTSSVDSNNGPRDKKIASFFFQDVENIQGSIKEIKEKLMLVSVKMNGVEKQIPMSLDFSGKDFTATGVMDIFDFAMSSHLKALNKACLELHEGKTWSDVELKLYGKVSKDCE